MQLGLTEDQTLLTDAFARFFETESAIPRVRAAEPLGFDPALWRALGDMGALAMRLPGEMGMGTFEAALVMGLAGRHLASAPLAEGMLAVRLLAQLGAENDLLARAQAGEAVVTLALREAAGGAQLVPGGAVADAVLFLDGEAVRLVSQADKPASPENLGSNPIAPIVLPADAPAIASGPEARAAFLAAVEEWKLLNAAALVGMGQRALEMASEYAKERTQFGRPIGSFQAIAHPLADRLADITGADLLVWQAIEAAATGSEEAAGLICAAWWWAAKSSNDATTRALHTFGGYGLTLEYDIQLYVRRAKALALILGDPRDELLEAGRRLWLDAPAALPETGPVAIEFGWGEEAEAFARETKDFFDRELTPEWHAKSHYSYDGHDWELNRKMGKARLLFPEWPVEHGGRGLGDYAASAAFATWDDTGVTAHAQAVSNIVGQVMIRFGSERVKREIVPRLADGEIISALGYSEPSSGSDIFSAQSKAVRDGDHWIINGQKMFTSGGNLADHVLMLVRTDPAAPKHKGITLFIVPTSDPGFEVHPVHTFQDERTNATFYRDIRIHDDYRIGEVNGALEVLGWALSLEQGGFGFVGPHRHVVKEALAWARGAMRGNKPAIEDERVLERLAGAFTRCRLSHLVFWRSMWLKVEGRHDRAAGPMSKLVSSEYLYHDANDLIDLAAPDTLLRAKHALGRIELEYRHSQVTMIYGGTSEVQRSQVAEGGLGLPKSR